ncbi:hypothetical protein P7K49_039267 [Saguinus oedipus]|uniref:VWFA domain-containing protein n=1 Tax=Saguinus oedipus TaxID=9490 RepID=A0ABQ9TH27_SAGOE|nr:hypothetical protein P7K49_039267 [Saguinus oedipus]
MPILLFLVDTSASMNQRTDLGTSYLDIAKGAVELFLKLRARDPASRGDRYMLVTYDEPPYCIKVKGPRSAGAAYTPAPARDGPASLGGAGGGGAQRAGGMLSRLGSSPGEKPQEGRARGRGGRSGEGGPETGREAARRARPFEAHRARLRLRPQPWVRAEPATPPRGPAGWTRGLSRSLGSSSGPSFLPWSSSPSSGSSRLLLLLSLFLPLPSPSC